MTDAQIASTETDAGIAGFAKLRWGMTKAQIAGVYPTIFEEWSEVSHCRSAAKCGRVVHYGLRGYVFGGCHVDMTMDFLNQELAAVLLKHTGTVTPQLARARMRDKLCRQYGLRLFERESSKFRWNDGDTTISYWEAIAPFTLHFAKTGALEQILQAARQAAASEKRSPAAQHRS